MNLSPAAIPQFTPFRPANDSFEIMAARGLVCRMIVAGMTHHINPLALRDALAWVFNEAQSDQVIIDMAKTNRMEI